MNLYHKCAQKIQKYLDRVFAPEDKALQKIKVEREASGLPPIEVTPLIGKTLYLLAKLIKAEKILEIGTLGGYSTAWLARALPIEGSLISIEINKSHAEAARRAIKQADLKNVLILEGAASLKMEEMIAYGTYPFDLIFLDADKQGYPGYIESMIKLTRPGGLILADNVIRRGRVIEPDPHDAQMLSLAKFNEMIASDPRLESVILPTLVGYVGGDLDGLSLSRLI